MDQIKIGKFISKCRKDKGLTQEMLSERLGLSINAVSKWERGICLPDYSNMKELCDVLEISINELFAGDKIEKKEISNQSERNILDLLKYFKEKKNKYKIFHIILIFILFVLVIICSRFLLIKRGVIIDNDLKYTQIYIAGDADIKGNVDINSFGKINIDFDVGANKYGYAVFKNPNKAFSRLKKDYKKGIELIRREFHLLPLTSFNYSSYKIYGWQVTCGSDEEKEQARFISKFLDIYENSFNK